MFSLEIRPDQLSVITLKDASNLSFLEFLKYYEIKDSVYSDQSMQTALFLFWLSRSFSDFQNIKDKSIDCFINFT